MDTFVCPSDSDLVDARHPVAGLEMPMSSYLGNGGSIEDAFVQWQLFSDGILMRSLDDRHLGIKLGAITDGTSNTFFSGETISYALAQGNPFIWDPAFYAATVNSGTAARTLTQIRTGHGQLNPDFETENDEVLRNSFGSRHPGGAVFVLVDGSTHFISNQIENINPDTGQAGGITAEQWNNGVPRTTYQRFFSRNDGGVVNVLEN